MHPIETQLREARLEYYNGTPIMSDKEFDALEEELRKIDPDSDYFKDVGVETDNSKKVVHEFPMRSMQKGNTRENIAAWYLRNNIPMDEEIIVQPKFDGLSCDVYFQNGKIVRMATRGNGKEGQDISRWIPKIHFGESAGDFKHVSSFHLRGELILPKVTTLKQKYPDSPLRNIVAGLINRKEDPENEIENVHFVAYDIISDYEFESEVEKMKYLDVVGERFSSIYELNKNYESWIENRRSEFQYEIDGLILKPNSINLQNRLEDGNEHHPVWAIAWKFPNEGKWTNLRSIEWNTSRLGRMIPVAVFDSINIGGSNISRATLSDYQNVKDLNLGEGSRIYVERANDVIPYINRKKFDRSHVKSHIEPFYVTTVTCKCGNEVTYKSQSGVHLICDNPDCSERQFGEILFWVKQIGIENFSGATVKTLFERGLVKSIPDLYKLTEDSLQGIPGIGVSKIKNILSELERTKTLSELDLLSKLGIEMVGRKALVKLGIKTLEDFRKFDDEKYVIGQKVIDWKNEPLNMALLNTLESIVTIKKEDPKAKGLGGLKICATGKAPIGRKELINVLESKGHTWVDSVNKETELLLTDDLDSDSSKIKKAKKLGIPVKLYSEFF